VHLVRRDASRWRLEQVRALALKQELEPKLVPEQKQALKQEQKQGQKQEQKQEQKQVPVPKRVLASNSNRCHCWRLTNFLMTESWMIQLG
jgi:hypothetical protein